MIMKFINIDRKEKKKSNTHYSVVVHGYLIETNAIASVNV